MPNMNDHCFCHLGGYAVKDAAARQQLKRTNAFSLNNVVCIGDSYLEGYTPTGGAKGWGAYLEEYVKKENPDAMFYFSAEGGAGFSAKGYNGNNFINLLSKQKNSMSANEVENVETVLIVGGVNDVRSGKIAAPQSTIDVAKNYFPNAKIVVAMSPLCRNEDCAMFPFLTKPPAEPDTLILTDSCYWLLGFSAYRSDDLLHPKTVGYKTIARNLYDASRGMTNIRMSQYQVEYGTGEEYKVNILYYIQGGMMSVYLTGRLNEGVAGAVKIGEKPEWMHPTRDIAIPIWASAPNTWLYFCEAGTFIMCDPHEGELTVNGTGTVSLNLV